MQTQTVLLMGHPNETTHLWFDAFRQRGFKVVTTSSSADVQRVWREAAPMLTVVDTSIPFEECLRLCRDLRALAPAPILLILASTNGNELTEAYRAGATECLIQPASPAVILLKALAWSMRSGWANVHLSHEWMPAGPLFQNGYNITA